MAKSRLGDPAPMARSGAARFASALPAVGEKKSDVLTSQRQSVEAPKLQKQPMTIRLTAEAIERLAEIEQHMRRAGIPARQRSASEIVEALLTGANLEQLRERLVG